MGKTIKDIMESSKTMVIARNHRKAILLTSGEDYTKIRIKWRTNNRKDPVVAKRISTTTQWLPINPT